MENSPETKTDENECNTDLTSKCSNEVSSAASLATEDTATGKLSKGDDEALTASQLESTASADDDDDDRDAEDEARDGGADEPPVTSNEGDSKEAIDPYGYLTRGDFSSEIYKVELMNLPKRFGIAQLKKKLVFMGLSPCKIKTEQRDFAYVTFRSEADRQKAFDVLQGHIWKNRPIRVKMAAANADPLMMKRKQEADDGEPREVKRMKKEDTVPDDLTPAQRLNNSVTPMWTVPYDEQLRTKDSTIKEFIRRLGQQIERNNETAKKELKEQRSLNDGLCCQLHPIKPSPVLHGYRNKCEFTIGRSPDGKDNTVGFRFGAYREGVVSVLEPDDCVNITPSMKTVAKALQMYLQTKSERSAFNPTDRQGHWKEATVRTTRSGSVMVIVSFHPQSLAQEEMEKEKELLSRHFESLQLDGGVTISSLYFQAESDRKDKYEDGLCYHLLGEKFIEEDLMNMKFRISPLAFFQVNSEAAEVLYGTIADWCKITPNTTLLDICCGTGTIGLTMAKKVKKVVGIEVSSQAVEDAKINARINGVENAEFLCGKAEDLLPSLMWRVGGDDVVVVVDPPRAGLHADVIRAIRKSPFVNHLIYVSCKPTAALSNIVDFTRQASKRVGGVPFRLIQAVPVDMFPHTEHCELVLMLERDAQDRS